MSNSDDEAEEICASCGIIAGDDGAKMKRCSGCKLVAYCNTACQKEHWSQHKRACKTRAAELREELLFKQPEGSHLGDCPICFLPLSLNLDGRFLNVCCSKVVCIGCAHAHRLQQLEDSAERNCPFCRTPAPKTKAEADQIDMRRIKVNDPVAICQKGAHNYAAGNYSCAFECLAKAAGLDDVEAHAQLGIFYMDGHGADRDKKKEIRHWEEAAIGGHPGARCNLAIHEGKMGNIARAVKHDIIAANMGHIGSMERVREGFTRGFVQKADFEAAIRAHEAAKDETKSPQREVAARYLAQTTYTPNIDDSVVLE